MSLSVNFQSYIIDNFDKRTEGLVEEYYQKNRAVNDERDLRKLCLYEKALINRDVGDYERSNFFYKQLLEQDLFKDDEFEGTMIELFICQNYIKSNEKKEALRLINNYFNKDKRLYDLDYLVCYAKITEDKIIQEPYLSVSKEVLFNLGYKEGLPKLYKDLVQIDDLYRKESEELGNIIMLQENQERTMRIDSFIKNTKFNFLSSKLNK